MSIIYSWLRALTGHILETCGIILHTLSIIAASRIFNRPVMNSTHLEDLLNGPALSPPPGVTPQLDNPPSYRAATTVIPTLCLTIATLSVAMRVYTRVRIINVVNIADCKHLPHTSPHYCGYVLIFVLDSLVIAWVIMSTPTISTF